MKKSMLSRSVQAAAACVVMPSLCPAGVPRAGLAAVDITPPLGIPMAGYYHERGADGVIDPLFSKALVLEVDGQRAALVSLDIISITRSLTDQARAAIGTTAGIAPERVLISATHAHTGPELANRNRRSPGGPKAMTVDYTNSLPARIAESVRLANERLQPVRLRAARGSCDGLAFNRRYFMRDGSTGWNPGKLNPDIMLPAGPSDPELGILYLEKPDAAGPAESLGAYVNFAMHPDTTGGTRISADWPGALGRVLAAYHGPSHLTLVGNGACGNINHLDFSWPWPQTAPGEQNRIATILGAAVFQACKNLEPLAPAPLQARQETIELALPEITAREAEEARHVLDATKNDQGGNFMKLVRAHRALDVLERAGKPHRVEVQAIALGRDLAWVGLPGEVFVELGLAIKKRSPFRQTMIVELANECIGYIPDRRSYGEGNYEPESARCAAGSGEKLVDAAAAILADLHRSAGSRAPVP